MFYYVLLITGLILIDQFIKHWVSINIAFNSIHHVIPGLLNLTKIHNNGAAWSLFSGQIDLLSVISIIMTIILLIYLWKFRKRFLYVLNISLMLSGAISNLIDRLLHKYVIDMFQFAFLPNFPISNFADWCLSIGTIGLIIIIILDKD